jgi:hypothetical protein
VQQSGMLQIIPTVVVSSTRVGQSTTNSESSPFALKSQTLAGALPFMEFPSNVRVSVKAKSGETFVSRHHGSEMGMRRS